LELLQLAVKVRDEGFTPEYQLPEDTPSYLRKLAVMCWAFSPDQRPTFAQIVAYLVENAPKEVNVDLLMNDNVDGDARTHRSGGSEPGTPKVRSNRSNRSNKSKEDGRSDDPLVKKSKEKKPKIQMPGETNYDSIGMI
jgi:hypothetical protein